MNTLVTTVAGGINHSRSHVMRTIRMCGGTLAMLLALGGSAWAQVNAEGVVSGTGAVTITRPAETMRLQIAILGRGTTLKDALKALKERTEDATEELVELGADKKSIKVDEPRVQESQNDRRRQLEMMMMQRMQAAGKASKKAKVAPPVIVAATLTAEWKLTEKD